MIKKVRAAGLLIENKKGEILALLRRNSKPEGRSWGLVGGKIKSKETKEEGIIREAYEEIKLKIQPKDFEFIKTFNWKIDDLNIEFELFRLKAKSNVNIVLSEKEFENYMWGIPRILFKRKNLMVGLYDILKVVYKII